MKKYKIIFGYDSGNFISIDETELEKAVYCHITGKVAVLKGGTVSGNNIMAIVPDIHGMMGWNYGHKLEAPDYAEARGKVEDAKSLMHRVQDVVRGHLEAKTEHLIGKTDYSKPPEGQKQLSDGAKALADKMRFNG